jgi:hypothetical protein
MVVVDTNNDRVNTTTGAEQGQHCYAAPPPHTASITLVTRHSHYAKPPKEMSCGTNNLAAGAGPLLGALTVPPGYLVATPYYNNCSVGNNKCLKHAARRILLCRDGVRQGACSVGTFAVIIEHQPRTNQHRSKTTDQRS